jgi:hypothetical protein
MTAMNAVEIADRDYRTAQAAGRLTVAHDEKAFCRHELAAVCLQWLRNPVWLGAVAVPPESSAVDR